MRLGASGSLRIFLRVSLGNGFIKPQVQGILGIHLISGRLSYKVVSALLYCSTMFVLLVGWGGAGFFFLLLLLLLHLHSVYKSIMHWDDPEELTNGFSTS